MTLRTRTSRPSAVGSGPGRPRLSDGRLRRRRRSRRHSGPEPAAVRRRAEALLGAVPGRPAEPSPVPHLLTPQPLTPHPPPPSVVEEASGAPPGEPAGPSPGAARAAALRERLPVWLQVRCAMAPRTVAAVAVVLVGAVGFAGQQYLAARPRPVTAPAVLAPGAQAAAGDPAPAAVAGAATGSPPGSAGAARIVVDVGGKVREPGVRRLPAGSRVEDALAAAGGVRPGTDTTGLNRARVLVDGEQVLVGAPAQPPPGGGGGGGGPGGPSAGPLSLGTATVEQLDGLPGVGPVLAQHIVDFRTARGGFRSVEELRQVNGIGERRFADLRTLVRP